MGIMPTSIVSYPYWSRSNMVTEEVGAWYQIRLRFARLIDLAYIVEE